MKAQLNDLSSIINLLSIYMYSSVSEVLCGQQNVPSSVIILFILMTYSCDRVIISKGELRCWLLLGRKRSRSVDRN